MIVKQPPEGCILMHGSCSQSFPSSVFDVSSTDKTGENLKVLMVQEKNHIEAELGGHVVAWVSDAGGDSKKARSLLTAMFPHLINLDCTAHQVCSVSAA